MERKNERKKEEKFELLLVGGRDTGEIDVCIWRGLSEGAYLKTESV